MSIGDDLLRARFRDKAVREQLDATIAELGTEEVMVLGLLARRLLAGQAAYGHLRLADDVRDLELERGHELADASIYGAMAELKRILARKGGR